MLIITWLFQALGLRACTVCRLLVSCVALGDLRDCFRVIESVEMPFESIENKSWRT